MAELGRTVRVSGLPTGIEDDKLKDKLFIHFLRARNGGGEIDSVIIVKATPVSALVTFEDSRVAQRLIHGGRHTLDVDGKKYKLTIAEHHERPDPDQVIPKLSATVQYSHLPGGVMALINICKNHCDVDVNYVSAEESCILSGAFSKVQALLAQLLGHPEGSRSAENKNSSEAAPGVLKHQKSLPQEPEHQRTNPNKQQEKKKHMDKPAVEYNRSSGPELTPGGHDWDDTGQTESAARQLPSTSVEDFSLIVDGDMYQYVQKHCQIEYQDILSHYGVVVVDMTSQGVTTLFLQVAEEGKMREGVNQQEHLKMAKKAISMFYQENETKICRDQVPKVILSSRGELKRAIETLSVSHPKVLLNEDEHNIYLIGSSSDVSAAKLFLLRDRSTARDSGVDGARLLKSSPYPSGSPTRANEDGLPPTASSIGGFLDEKLDHLRKSDEDERRANGAGRYKLAAKFKDLGAAGLGSRTTDFTSRAKPSVSKQSRPGPMLGYDVLSDTSKVSGEGVSRTAAQNTGGDILFKEGYLPSFASASNKTSLSPEEMDVLSKTPTSVSTTPASLSGSTVIPPAGSGATLRRSNSFSGTSQKKAQVSDQTSEENPSKSKVRTRGRSSSFSSQTPREKLRVHIAELTVFGVIWYHIKDAYRTQLDDLTSDVQMTEGCSDKKTDVTVTIRGATSSKVSSCQVALQQLIDTVSSDFSVQDLPLSVLGVTDTTDETLQACCSEVRSRFKKVTFQFFKENMFLLGPEGLCSQVCSTLREVFSGGSQQIPAEHHSSSLSTSQGNILPSVQMNKGQSINPHFNAESQVAPESKTNGTGWIKDWQTTYSQDFCDKGLGNRFTGPSSIKKDHVIKEKVKITDAVGTAGQNSNSSENDISKDSLNGVKSTTTWAEEDGGVHVTIADSAGRGQANDERTGEESPSSRECSAFLCLLCRANGKSVTKCGVIMCSKCQKHKHKNCRVCNEVAQKPLGIQGQMSHIKLSISLPGHSKFSTVMITYHIQDGIQGERHPFPGEPFRGGEFKAYLPDCVETKKLLPRLKKALRQGLTFTVTSKDSEAKITWDCIPHKTSLQGGKSENGYPDSTYLKRLSEVLTQHGIEE